MVTELDWKVWCEERLLYCNTATLVLGQELPSVGHFRVTCTPKTFFQMQMTSLLLMLLFPNWLDHCNDSIWAIPCNVTTSRTWAIRHKMPQHSKPIAFSSTDGWKDSCVHKRSHSLDFRVKMVSCHVQISSDETVQPWKLSGCGLCFRRPVF